MAVLSATGKAGVTREGLPLSLFNAIAAGEKKSAFGPDDREYVLKLMAEVLAIIDHPVNHEDVPI